MGGVVLSLSPFDHDLEFPDQLRKKHESQGRPN